MKITALANGITPSSEMSWNCSETCPQEHPGHDYRVENYNLSLETGMYPVVGTSLGLVR